MKSSELVRAPRGLLKMYILDIASKYPISGIEISENVSSITKGVWKPGPGSIYYILKELVSKKRLSEIYFPDKNIRKYIATEKGLDELSIFKSFSNEIIEKQLAFLIITSRIIPNKEVESDFKNYLSKFQD
jgi:DNA-binding PadR family transcriptional regulator